MSIPAIVLSPFSIENGISDIFCFRVVILSPHNCSYTSMEVLTLIFAVLLPYFGVS